MRSLTLANLESLLRARKLDGTLTSALPFPHGRDECGVVPTDVASLDELLGGGFPRGHLSEIVGPRSTGRTSVLCALLAATAARGELAALVDTLDTFDPASGAAAGIDLSHLLWIRGGPAGTEKYVCGPRMLALNRALKALSLVLHAGGFSVVALDVADVPAAAIRRIPFTTWMRLSRAIEGSKTVGVLLGPEPIARSAAGQTLVLQPGRAAGRWSGDSDRARLFRGLDIQARLICARRQNVGGSCRLATAD